MCVTFFIAAFTLLQRSRTGPAISLRYVCGIKYMFVSASDCWHIVPNILVISSVMEVIGVFYTDLIHPFEFPGQRKCLLF